ncbi:MAG: hypothetical protein Q3966_03115 [Neisseria sp.]|nr:hypothetical protein [Neisseria sp.]
MRTILATLLAALAVNAHADTIPAECEKALQGTFEWDKRIGGSFARDLTRQLKLPLKVQKQPDGWKIAGHPDWKARPYYLAAGEEEKDGDYGFWRMENQPLCALIVQPAASDELILQVVDGGGWPQERHFTLAYALTQDEEADPRIAAKVSYVYGLSFRLAAVTGGWLGVAVKKTR